MAKVLLPFRDRETWRAYVVGDEYDGTPERLETLIQGGYVQSGLIAHDAEENGSDNGSGLLNGNLDVMTVAQLREIAESRGIDLPKRVTKEKLLEILGA